MGRYTGPKHKLCRREGEKLFGAEHCPVKRRPYPPGGQRRRRFKRSQYWSQLRGKQKAKRIYGLRERQFKRYVNQAKGKKGPTGDHLLQLLERRLDNVIYRASFSSTRAQARQLVTHGHFQVNNRRVNIPAYQVREGDVIQVKENSRVKKGIVEIVNENEKRPIPEWIEADRDGLRFTILKTPDPEQVEHTLQTDLIVEFYSR
ncbi:MAG: 30S ribosomal protein S4 [Candidatus Bipolaricaulia bacterium]